MLRVIHSLCIFFTWQQCNQVYTYTLKYKPWHGLAERRNKRACVLFLNEKNALNLLLYFLDIIFFLFNISYIVNYK